MSRRTRSRISPSLQAVWSGCDVTIMRSAALISSDFPVSFLKSLLLLFPRLLFKIIAPLGLAAHGPRLAANSPKHRVPNIRKVKPHAQHTRTPLHPAALASVPYGVVLVRVRVRAKIYSPG